MLIMGSYLNFSALWLMA